MSSSIDARAFPRKSLSRCGSWANDDVLDFLWIQSQLGQALDDLVFNRVIEDRIDNDDPFRRIDGPRRILGHADEVEVIKHSYWFRVPPLTLWRTLRLHGCRLAAL